MAYVRRQSSFFAASNWTLVGIRNNLALLTIGLYLVLNWGFMLVRFPPGGGAAGVPIGELLLLVFLFSINDAKWLPKFSRSIFLVPFVLWWSMGVGRALLAVPAHGMWALRDATHVVESLFLWVGFVYAARPGAVELFFKWLRRVLMIASIYGFTYPYRFSLFEYSPTVEGAAGYTTTLLFWYVNTARLMLMEAARRLIVTSIGSRMASLLFAGVLIAFAVIFFQARTVYLQLVAIVILFVWLHRAAFGRISLALMIGALAFLFIASSGIEFTGRLGQAVSLDFLVKHFAAIIGIESEGVVGAARGVGKRLEWWHSIWRQLTESTENFFFGLGYGIPLIDFLGFGNRVVREPHNSYMSILGRLGVFGLFAFVWGHALLLRVWFRAYNLCRRAGHRVGRDRLLILMVYFIIVWIDGFTEGGFELPFFCIPYYFFWGIILQYHQQLQHDLQAVNA